MSIYKYTNENCFTCAQPFYGNEECHKYHNKCLPIKKMANEYLQNVNLLPFTIEVRAVGIARVLQIKRLVKRASRIKKEALKKENIKSESNQKVGK